MRPWAERSMGPGKKQSIFFSFRGRPFLLVNQLKMGAFHISDRGHLGEDSREGSFIELEGLRGSMIRFDRQIQRRSRGETKREEVEALGEKDLVNSSELIQGYTVQSPIPTLNDERFECSETRGWHRDRNPLEGKAGRRVMQARDFQGHEVASTRSRGGCLGAAKM